MTAKKLSEFSKDTTMVAEFDRLVKKLVTRAGINMTNLLQVSTRRAQIIKLMYARTRAEQLYEERISLLNQHVIYINRSTEQRSLSTIYYSFKYVSFYFSVLIYSFKAELKCILPTSSMNSIEHVKNYNTEELTKKSLTHYTYRNLLEPVKLLFLLMTITTWSYKHYAKFNISMKISEKGYMILL